MADKAELDRYVIPHNYKDRGGIFGLFKTRNFIEGCICAVTLLVLILPIVIPLKLPIVVKTFIIFIPCFLIWLVGIIGFNEEPWSSAILYLISYKKHKRKLSYKFPEPEVSNNGKKKYA